MKNYVSKSLYACSGLTGRLKSKICPACGSKEARSIARKVFHTFSQCSVCGLAFRYPVEDATQMLAFYQEDYEQSGLTTDLPDIAALNQLKENNFKGSSKDFSDAISFFGILGLASEARILDFGANWGYASYQFRQAGYQTDAFEVSQPRAAFGQRLGIDIKTRLEDVSGPFDACFSSHVLEHVPNPLDSLRTQMALTKTGGFVLGVTPNGSLHRLANEARGYNRNWGRVHPVLLTETFIAYVAGERPYYVGSGDRFPTALNWGMTSACIDDMRGSILYFVIAC